MIFFVKIILNFRVNEKSKEYANNNNNKNKKNEKN